MASPTNLSAADEAVRDLKKQLLRHGAGSSEQKRPRTRSSPPEMGRESPISASAIAQPGGFRRHFLVERGIAVQGPSLLDKAASVMGDPSKAMKCLLAEEVCFSRQVSQEGSSSWVTVLIVVKTFLTGTILIVPGGFRKAGVFGGAAAVMTVGCLEVYCMCLLVRCRSQRGAGDYSTLGEALGPHGPVVISVMLVISQYGFVCAEQIYVAENALACLGHFCPWLRQWHLLFFFQLILVPMSWVRNLKFFAVTNLVGDGVILGCLLYLFVFGACQVSQDGPSPDMPGWGPPVSQVMFMGVCTYLYEGINMVLPIYESHQNKGNFEKLLAIVLATLTAIFIAFGALWVAAFGDGASDVATNNLVGGSTGAMVVPPLYSLACLLTTPVLFFPIAPVFEPRVFSDQAFSHLPVTRMWAENGLRSALMLASAGIAAVGGQQLQNFLAVLGGLSCGPLAIIFPAAISLRWGDLSAPRRALSYIIIAVGVCITVFSASLALATWK